MLVYAELSDTRRVASAGTEERTPMDLKQIRALLELEGLDAEAPLLYFEIKPESGYVVLSLADGTGWHGYPAKDIEDED